MRIRAASRLLRGRFTTHTRGLAQDTFLLGLAFGLGTLGLVAQVALITHSLGLAAFGTFSLVVSVVSVVSRFFDVQVGNAAISFGAEEIGRDMRAAQGVIQFSYLVDLLTGVLGFLAVLAIAPFAGPALIGTDGTLLLALYGLTLLASTVDGTSISTLQLFNRYGVVLGYHILRESFRLTALLVAIVYFDSLTAVVLALVAQDALAGLVGLALSARAFARESGGRRLSQPALGAARHVHGPMLRMIFHTNFVSYARIAQTQLPAIVLGAVRGPFDVGAFKVGTSVGQVIARLGDPAWSAVLPRLSRLWAARELAEIRTLVRQGTVLAAVVMGAAAALAIVFREPILRLFAGEAATAASSVVVLAVLTQALNAVLFWNAPFLIAAKRARIVSLAYVSSAIVLVPLLFACSEAWGATGAMIALAASIVTANVVMTIGAVRVMREPRPAPVDLAGAAASE